MGPLELCILFLAAAAQGFLGFGFGIVAMGGLSLLQDLHHSVALVNVTGLVTTAGLALVLRRHADWRLVLRLAPGAAAGIAAGVYLLGALDARPLKLGMGVTIALISAWNLSSWRPALRAAGSGASRLDAPVSLLSGLFTGLFNMGGPPLIAHVYRLDEPPDVLRGTIQALLLMSVTFRLLSASLNGMITESVMHDAATGVVVAIAGAAAGLAIGRRISADRFRRATWAALGLLGVGIAISSV
jgi:uncharacterized membrane protein YfcA